MAIVHGCIVRIKKMQQDLYSAAQTKLFKKYFLGIWNFIKKKRKYFKRPGYKKTFKT